MKNDPLSPPKIPEWLLTKLSYWIERHSLIDDLEEEYHINLSKRGKTYSQLWYWSQIFRAIPTIVSYSIYRNAVMIKNYALIALRNIRKRKIFSFINITGLAISLSLCLFVVKLTFTLYSSDRFHEKKDRIYRVISQTTGENDVIELATAPLPLMYELEQIPEIETVIRIKKNFGGAAAAMKKILMVQGLYADKDFFHVFSYELEAGNPKTCLSEPYSLVVTKELSQKFFGTRSSIGEILSIQDLGDFKITGVMKDTSKLHSHMRFECLASLSTLNSLEKQKKIIASLENWKNLNDNYVYFLLRENASPNRIEELFPAIVKKHYPDTETEYIYSLQALTKISPGKNLGNFLSTPAVSPQLPLLLSGISLLIMIIACFNYTNLSLAKALSRAKEVGIRKAIGANRFKLITQFIGEAVTYALIAFILALILLKLVIPVFVSQMPLYTGMESQSLGVILFFIMFTVFTGFLAGIIPALYISKFNPAEVLRDITKAKIFSRINLRRALVVFQFFISFVFIITTIVLYKQVRLEKNIDTGFNAENILNVELQNTNYETFKQEISTHPAVSRVSASAFILCTGARWGTRAKTPDASEFFEVDFISIDNDFIENFELELVAGENFPEMTHPENERFVILNEMAVERFGFESPLDSIGQIITFRENKHLEVTGVVKDFLSQSTSSPVNPQVLRIIPEYFEYANLKIRTDDMESTLLFLETKWRELEPFRPFTYSFFEDQLEDYFAEVENVVRSVYFIAFLAILIAFFGLLGMVIYDTEARVKEIGIRKVMGASVIDIILVTSKSFVFLLLLAATLATPVAWLINNMLLQDLSTRIELGFGIFAFGLLMMFALGFITIFSQTIRAAFANPVDSLRYE